MAKKIAANDLRVQVKPQSPEDELGSAFATMVSNLRRSTTDLAESVNVLASSASEILASTTQVAAGAAETGTAITQTTSTIEEVKQTAQVASQKAKYVADNAQKAAQVSLTGRKAVESSIEGMRKIQKPDGHDRGKRGEAQRAEPVDRRNHRDGQRSRRAVEPLSRSMPPSRRPRPATKAKASPSSRRK